MVDLSGHATQDREFAPEHIALRNARYGRVLFAIYLSLYGAFVILNTFWPSVMDTVPAAGVNLAIWFGLALIVGALVLAIIYSWLCREGAPADRGPLIR